MSDPKECCDGGLLRRDLDEVALKLAVAGFATLWRGDRRPPSELLPTQPGAALVAHELAAHGRAEVDHEGRLVGVHGLTMRPTRHRFTDAGHEHHTWCAVDSIGIPAALDVENVAHTDCPGCGADARDHDPSRRTRTGRSGAVDAERLGHEPHSGLLRDHRPLLQPRAPR